MREYFKVIKLNFLPKQPEFVDGGTETSFTEDGHLFILSARSSLKRNEGIHYKLSVNGRVQEVPDLTN